MVQLDITKCGKTEFLWGKRTYVMGIINMSPESFSSDGIADVDSAIEQAQRFVSEGADILDVGGESTRPGLASISTSEEIKRVIPVIERLSNEIEVPISVDTSKLEVAERALEAGAAMLNDQWGLKTEPRLAELAAMKGVPIILMSNQRDEGSYDATTNRDIAFYEDVMKKVNSTLRQGIALALKAGVLPENIVIDPGIGFGKTWQQDLEIVRRLRELKELGRPVIIGTSRKSLIKMVLNLPASDRIEGTAATVAVSITNGADMVRVHDVRQMVRVCRVADAIVRT
ncbi:dihydropteroate synthase [Chloroflexota bacterium]